MLLTYSYNNQRTKKLTAARKWTGRSRESDMGLEKQVAKMRAIKLQRALVECLGKRGLRL